MKKCRHIIREVEAGSIAEELELAPGDELLSINGQEIEDVFDYHYLVNDEYIEVLVQKADGEQWELEVEKDYEEDLRTVSWTNTVPAAIIVSSALLTRCPRA